MYILAIIVVVNAKYYDFLYVQHDSRAKEK